MKIGILSRKASLYSTRRIAEAARSRGHEALILDHAKCVMMMEEGNPAVHYMGTRLDDLDAVIPRIGASITFFGTAVVRQFETMNVFTTAGSQALVRSRDKLRSLQLLAKSRLGIPKTIFARFPKDKDVESLVREIGGAPVVIKLLEGTQGLGVVLADTVKAAKSVVEAFSGMRVNILIQEFIREAGGADIRAFVVDGEVVGAMKREGAAGEFRSNIHRGGKGTVIKLSRREKQAAVRAARLLGLGVAGVDMIQSARGPLLLEVNSSPGLEGIEGATGLDIAGKIIEYVERNAPLKKKATRRKKTLYHA